MVNKLKNRLALIGVVVLASFACAGNNDNAHTTATTFVSPPPRQILHAESRPQSPPPALVHQMRGYNKPQLGSTLTNGSTFRQGEGVAITFYLINAKLRDEGGDFRIRYIVDDDDPKWIDRREDVVLTGWIPGNHTIRLELIGPDGWPLKDNISMSEITVE